MRRVNVFHSMQGIFGGRHLTRSIWLMEYFLLQPSLTEVRKERIDMLHALLSNSALNLVNMLVRTPYDNPTLRLATAAGMASNQG